MFLSYRIVKRILKWQTKRNHAQITGYHDCTLIIGISNVPTILFQWLDLCDSFLRINMI